MPCFIVEMRFFFPGKVGPQTGWLCPNDDCTPCDMYLGLTYEREAVWDDDDPWWEGVGMPRDKPRLR